MNENIFFINNSSVDIQSDADGTGSNLSSL